MTPNNNTTIYNDAPEESLRKMLKCAIMKLDEKDRFELLKPYLDKYFT